MLQKDLQISLTYINKLHHYKDMVSNKDNKDNIYQKNRNKYNLTSY